MITELCRFHQHLKPAITWLLSIGYEFHLLSNGSLTRGIACLSNYIRNQFLKWATDFVTGGCINLIVFGKKLEKKP